MLTITCTYCQQLELTQRHNLRMQSISSSTHVDVFWIQYVFRLKLPEQSKAIHFTSDTWSTSPNEWMLPFLQRRVRVKGDSRQRLHNQGCGSAPIYRNGQRANRRASSRDCQWNEWKVTECCLWPSFLGKYERIVPKVTLFLSEFLLQECWISNHWLQVFSKYIHKEKEKSKKKFRLTNIDILRHWVSDRTRGANLSF